MSWNLALEINKLVSITRVSGNDILIYNSTGTKLASYKTTGLFLGDADAGGASAGTNSFVAPSYGSFTFGGITATPPKILSGGGTSLYYRSAGHNFQNLAGTLGEQVNTGAIVASGNISSTGSVNVASVVSTGAISGTTITGTGAISGASVVSTGAISGTTITGTGAISGTSVVSTGAISGTTITGTGDLTIATSASIICNNYSNNGDNNVNFTAFSSGNNPSLIFNSRSSNSATASGRWGLLNSVGWQFEDGVSASGQTQTCGINQYGFYLPNTGYIFRGVRYNQLTSTSRFNTQDLVFYNNGGGAIEFIGGNIGFNNGMSTYYWGPTMATAWTINVNSANQWVVSQAGSGINMYLLPSTSQTLWSTTSDERKKQDITPIEPVSSALLKLQVKSYRYISQPTALKSVGFIAQDIRHIPELADYMVSESPDTAEDGTPYLGVNQSVLIPYLVKGFQEQHAIITDLKAQLASLKAVVDALVAQKEILVV
jgi:hypothetical protein